MNTDGIPITPQPTSQKQETNHSDFPVVGMGASAGGLKALIQFFELMPASSGMAFVVILHLSPKHESHSADLLQNVTKMPVMQVNEAVRVEPNHVYVIPPTKHLSMQDGMIRLTDPDRQTTQQVAVDLFFRTLADTQRDRAVCIVLSGVGSDGAVGLKRVKEQGGLTLAQSPDDAEYDSMPRNAIGTGLVDFVLPVAEMPDKLVQLWQNASVIKLPAAEEPIRIVDPSLAAEEALREILLILRTRTGHDFTHYKRATVLRRIERRLQVNQQPDLPAYCNFLREHQEESRALLKDMLISVTNFFRDREAFESLERNVIPRLFPDKTPDDHVRVWVAGCATGEEAYSIAILLIEHAATISNPPGVQVFATDIDDDMLARAREGKYPASIITDIAPTRLRNFFTQEGDYYVVKKSVREKVLFASHNVLKDPPFSRLDMVSCRNLLIYLNREVQEQILELFHFTLRPGGYLFLGSSESADSAPRLFVTIDKKARVFKANAVSRLATNVPTLPLGAHAAKSLAHAQTPGRRHRSSVGELHQQLLEQYAPPSVIINHQYDIVHLSDRAGRFLQFAGGEPSHNLLKVIHPELRLDLRTALFQAIQTGKSTEARRVRLSRDGHNYYVNMIVRPAGGDDGQNVFVLVIFDEVEDILGGEGKEPHSDETRPVISHLEQELQRTKEQLQTTIEQYETSNEELKASNEELQAINEELRSTTEELETSKEELQSINEELSTVNFELKNKVDEVSTVNDDLKNLIASTDIATIFVDRALRIKRYTPRALDIFNLIPNDVGRSLFDITHRLDYPRLADDAAQAFDTLRAVEREVACANGRWYIARVLPYRTIDDKIDGAVLTFIDITESKLAQEVVEADLKDTRMLRDLSARLVTEGNIQVLYDEIMAAAVALMRADAGTVQILDGKTHELVMLATTGFEREFIDRFRRLDANSNTFCGMALATGERSFVDFDAPGVADPDNSLRMHVEAGYLSAQSTPLVTRFGKPIGMLSTHWRAHHRPGERELSLLDLLARQAADLIEHWQVTNALRESEQRQRLIIESVRDYAIMTMDTERRITAWNVGAETMFGYTADEIIGQSADILFTPEDRERGVPEEETEQARAAGRAADERWHLRKDGSRFYVSGVVSTLRDDGVSGFVKIARDLTEKKRSDEEIAESHEKLESLVENRTRELAESYQRLQAESAERQATEINRNELLHKLIQSQEEERRRISRDMHDHFGQRLTALRLNLETLREEVQKQPRLRERIANLKSLAEELDQDISFLAWELRPTALEDMGLVAALANFANEWSRRYDVPTEFHAPGLEKAHFSPEIELNLYRIAQEALNNISKHAKAGRVGVLIERRNNSLVLIIEDNGEGFDEAELGLEQKTSSSGRGLGLIGIRERAALLGGTAEIESSLGNGTTIIVRVPIAPAK